MNSSKFKILTSFLLVLSLFLTTGFTKAKFEPKTVYRVYLKGKSIGMIRSKEELEQYINKKQDEIKTKYNVKKVYLPADLDISKEITYKDDIQSIEEIYNQIKDISPFTINGYVVKIKGIESSNSKEKKEKVKTNYIYVLDKKVFTESIENTVKSFISEEDYKNYAEKTQSEIVDTGKYIDNLYIKNKITIKKDKIPIDKKIYLNKAELSKYLLFGTTEDQATYTIQDGDTIADVAFNNKMSVEEFLISNPSLHDENSLLSPGQVVKIGYLQPQFSFVEEDNIVFKEEKNYNTETEYDNEKNIGYEEVKQAGAKGENKVTQKVQKINGEIVNAVTTSTEVLKEPVTEIIVKGGKKSYYAGNSYGSVVATKGQWGWPATCSSISSPFGYRWGGFHDGTDIYGCGYNSSIFAVQSGTVVASAAKPCNGWGCYYDSASGNSYGDNGEYIVIDHHNGYFSIYAHLCAGCRVVSVGDYVEKGQIIGGMGMTGAATGIHLHYGMFVGGMPYAGGSAINAMILY